MYMKYANRDSLFHNLDPRSKMLWLIVVSFVAIFSADPVFILLIYIHNLLVWTLLSRLPKKSLISYNLRFGIIIFIICILVSFFDTWSLLQSMQISLIIAVKWLIVISSAMTFSMTTNPQDIVSALVKIRVPKSIAFSLGIGLRMLPLMMEEISSISKAQKARGFDSRIRLRNVHRFHSIFAPIITPLLVSSMKMIDEIVIALESRGFSIEQYRPSPFISISRRDGILIAALLAVLLGFLLFK